MLKLDLQKVCSEIGRAETEDLLDRVTAYREGMEPDVIPLIEQELRRRKVGPAQIEARREECRRECVFDVAGVAQSCSRCRRPAVAQAYGWHRLWGLLPLFPRWMRYCKNHSPEGVADDRITRP
jgi:hypothetical protein